MKNNPKNQIVRFTIIAVLGWVFISTFLHYKNVSSEGDAGCFSAISNQLLNGDILYKDVFDNKAPGIFFLHSISYIGISILQSVLGEGIPIGENQLLQLFCLAICIIPMGVISLVKLKSSPLTMAVNSLLLGFGLYAVVSFWPAMYVGGFTEEIGSYFFIAALCHLYLNKIDPGSPTIMITSGLFAGLSTWIKEPFILLIPAVLPYLVQLPKRQNIQWILGFSVPWLFYGLYCTVTGSWSNYISYLRFATNYASINSNESQNIFETVIHQLYPPLTTEIYPVTQVLISNVLVLLILTITILSLGYYLNKTEWRPTGFTPNNQRSNPTILKPIKAFISENSSHSNLILGLLSLILLLIGSLYFSGLGGKNAFPHYQLPWMFSLIFSSWMMVILLVDFIGIYQPSFSIIKKSIPLFTLSLFSTLCWILPTTKANYQAIKQQNFPPFQNQKEELKQWQEQLTLPVFNAIQSTSLYIDDPHSGRFYTLFNTQQAPPFPCPYFVYFYSPNYNQDTAVQHQLEQIFYVNAQRQMSYLQNNPPAFIITGNNHGFLTLNNTVKNWFIDNYKKTNQINYHRLQYNLYQRK
ncbi:MAG: hypothetical protein RLZZ252_502 [Bacteroidota bacterium]